jgi:hypothetical protein
MQPQQICCPTLLELYIIDYIFYGNCKNKSIGNFSPSLSSMLYRITARPAPRSIRQRIGNDNLDQWDARARPTPPRPPHHTATSCAPPPSSPYWPLDEDLNLTLATPKEET